MPYCPRCHKFVDSQAIICPHCQVTLKAHGHPGITLHQSMGETFLCESCVYDADDTCTFPQRPYAKTCTLYHNIAEPITEQVNTVSPGRSLKAWCWEHKGLLILISLFSVSILLALT